MLVSVPGDGGKLWHLGVLFSGRVLVLGAVVVDRIVRPDGGTHDLHFFLGGEVALQAVGAMVVMREGDGGGGEGAVLALVDAVAPEEEDADEGEEGDAYGADADADFGAETET